MQKFFTRQISLKTHGIKSLTMSGSENLVYFSIPAPWPDFPINRNLYKVVHLQSEQTVAISTTKKAAREIILRLEELKIDWSSAFTPDTYESNRLLSAQRDLAKEGLHYGGGWE